MLDWPTVGVVVTVVAVLLGGATFIVSKIFNLGKVSNRLEVVESEVKKIDDAINSTKDTITKRIDDLMILMTQSNLTVAHSPRQLSTEGIRIFESSGIKPIVEQYFDEIVEKVKERKPENAYQAEKAILDVVNGLIGEDDVKNFVEKGAFNSGSTVEIVLFVAGIFIRDKVLSEIGLRPEQIDQYNSDKK